MNPRTLLHFFLASALGAGLRFLLFPALSGSMAPEEFGKVGLYLATSPFLALVLGWSMTIPWVIGYHERDDDANRRLLGGVFVSIGLCWAALSALALVFHERVAAWIGPGLDATGVLEAVASVALSCLSMAYLELDKIRQESRRYLVASLAQSILQVGLALVFVRFTSPTFPMFVHGYLVANLVVLLLQAVARRGQGPRRPSFLASFGLWRAALPVSATTAFALVANLGDRHFVEAAAGLASVGVYTMAAKLGEIVQQLVHLPVLGAMTPVLLHAFGKDRAAFGERFEAELRRLLVLSVLASTALAAAIAPVYGLLLPEGYRSGIPVTLMFLLSFAIGVVGQGLAMPVLAHGRLGTFARFTAISAVVSLVANALLTPRMGSTGAAIASLIVQTTTLVQSYFASRSLPGWRPFENPTRILILVALAAPAMECLTVLRIPQPFAATGWRIGIFLGTITFLASPFLRPTTLTALAFRSRRSLPPD